MAVANAGDQRGSKCVTAAPWKSPMMASSAVGDDYFRVADGYREFRVETRMQSCCILPSGQRKFLKFLLP